MRLRTEKTKGCLSRKTALAMVFKLLLSARKKWSRLNGSNRLAEVIRGVRFEDGIRKIQNAAWSGHHQLSAIALEPDMACYKQ